MKPSLRTLRCCVLFGVLFGVLPCSARAGEDAPEWLRNLAATPISGGEGVPPAWVLLDAVTTEIDVRGEATETHRVAIRLRVNEAAGEFTSGSVRYNSKTGHVLSTEAWLIRKGKSVHGNSGSEWTDDATACVGTIIDETRERQINLRKYAVGGDVFGFETRVRRSLLVAQLGWHFGWPVPVQEERYSLVLPPGFAVNTITDGARSLVATTAPERNQWSWVLHVPDYAPKEPWVAPAARVDARLFTQVIPPPNSAGQFAPRTFVTWSDVATWCMALNAGQCDQSTELVAKARELTAGLPEPLAKIRALSQYVQKLRYVEVNEDLGTGRGYQARKASLVLSRGYGDCKDKSNLLRAMLREIGVTSYATLALLNQEAKVLEGCPSPAQFNHVILAISVDDAVKLPTVVSTEKWGQLLFFDPTDSHTILGDLPRWIQGTHVHLQAEGSDSLITLPVLPAQDDFSLQRKVRLQLAQDGSIKAEGSVAAWGQEGAHLRHLVERSSQPKELEQLISQQLGDGFRNAAVVEDKTEDDRVSGRCALVFTCTQKSYAQSLPGDLTVVKLDVLSRRSLPSFPEKVRYRPIELPPLTINDEVTLELPVGLVAEELPAASKLESPYGKYEQTCAVEQGAVVLRRTITFNKVEVPVADYDKLKKYLSDLARADRSSVLLKRQG
jgi:hypothetical protein